MQLNEIDELIKETEYDRALEELSIFMKENPEKFDAAQKRVSHILKMRTRYSNLANKLIDVLENDSGNDEKILQIISNLEQLEKHPSKTQQKFLSETKFTAQFNVYRKQLYALLKKGLDYAQEGEYVLATQTIKEGYLIYQKDFFETFTDSSITSPVRKTLSEIDELLVLYKTIQERFLKACVSFEASAKSENKNALQNEVESLQKVFSEYAVIRNNVFHRAALLEDVLKVVREKTHDTSDASFLPFAIRFTLGLKSMPYSGIIGTMDLEWDKNLQNLRKNVFSVITKTSADFYSVLQSSLQNSNAISSSSMENYVAFLQVGKSLVALDSLLEEQNKNQVSPTATLDENFLK
ncbi:MAG: hypothetical protein IKI31_02010, partial [Treponema sp.]|nr:hypothetical protein [Treponema sp.]